MTNAPSNREAVSIVSGLKAGCSVRKSPEVPTSAAPNTRRKDQYEPLKPPPPRRLTQPALVTLSVTPKDIAAVRIVPMNAHYSAVKRTRFQCIAAPESRRGLPPGPE
jgi:hypothetical protein